MTADVARARELAERLMAEQLPRRWAHVRAVAAKAERLRLVVEDAGDLLVASAWLHDVGYSPELSVTGFHPLDGARHLRSLGVDLNLCGLVAHHSGARYEADLRGLAEELAEFPDELSSVRHCLWFCDMTTSPTGETVTFDQRLTEIRQRYGEDDPVPRGIMTAADEIRTAIAAVRARASERGSMAG